MQRFMAGLPGPYAQEASMKCRPGHWTTQRWLFGVSLASVERETLRDELPSVLNALGMPREDRMAFLHPLLSSPERSPLHYLHLGIEDARCKAYWEMPMPDELAGALGRFVLYRAWKWQPGQVRAAYSEYVLLPSARQARAALHDELQHMPMLIGDLLEQLEVSCALKQMPWPPLMVRIEEWRHGQSTSRHSLNLHLHGARLPLGTVAGLLMALARTWESASRRTLVEWIAAHGDELLSNISLGVGEDRQPFFTCYHGGRLVAPNADMTMSAQTTGTTTTI